MSLTDSERIVLEGKKRSLEMRPDSIFAFSIQRAIARLEAKDAEAPENNSEPSDPSE